MAKKLILLLATIGLIANISGCTSNSSQDDTKAVENADVDKIELENSVTTEATADAVTLDSTDPSLQAALGEAPATTVTQDGTTLAGNDALALDTTTPPSSDVASTESVTTSPDMAAAPAIDESSLSQSPTPTDIASTPAPLIDTNPVASATDLAVTPSPMATDSSSSMDVAAPVEKKPKSAGSVLKKIMATAPYQTDKGWVNTVYVARPGETLKEISQKIFSADKSKELKKIAENSYLKSRSVKPGDKIYYISPNRSDDSSKTLLYYEDMGMIPESYVAKKGDKLKKVAKEILGYDKAWVELWTSNSIESQSTLKEGDTLKYWRSAASINTMAQNNDLSQGAPHLIDQAQAANMGLNPESQAAPPTQVAANTPPPAEMAPPPPPPTDMNSLPPPPPDSNAAATANPPPPDMNSLPPPPPAAEMAVPPPPPPPAEMAPPPPVEPVAVAKHPKKKSSDHEEEAPVGGLDNDTMISLGAVGVLTAALAFVLIRRKKKKAAEMAAASEPMEHNVGT